jgi:hypothetical protein
VPHPFRGLHREMGGRAMTLFEGRINSTACEDARTLKPSGLSG